ncbi:DUF350 domain-containing protein [Rubeoparvulum massiliense]|uniref:DUF350 domain-containing protein n=1 Tax=Rubeoparvulum massiliense TaxID=1631346 RepID=UPI000AFE3651|nr:DUF350 domain-containing protein [Rubeoparvulum massiliense]
MWFWENPYVQTVSYFMVAGLAIILFLTIFEMVTKYNDWEEIKKGNLAVAMATGGKVFGVANIFRFSIAHHDTILESIVWSGVGFLLLLFAYFIFEFMTPRFHVDQEIAKGNKAVGFLALIISISFSYVIGASITVM